MVFHQDVEVSIQGRSETCRRDGGRYKTTVVNFSSYQVSVSQERRNMEKKEKARWEIGERQEENSFLRLVMHEAEKLQPCAASPSTALNTVLMIYNAFQKQLKKSHKSSSTFAVQKYLKKT